MASDDDEFLSADEGEDPVPSLEGPQTVTDGRKFHRFAKDGEVLVLSVEDEPLGQQVIENLLVPLEYKFEQAMDGEEALEVLEELPEFPDVILLDYTLPDLTGDEVYAKIIEKYDSGNNIPFILTGGDLSRFNITAAPGKRKILKVEKPLTFQRLKEAIEQALAPA